MDSATGRDFAAPALSVAAMHLHLAAAAAATAAAASRAQLADARAAPEPAEGGGEQLGAAATSDEQSSGTCWAAALQMHPANGCSAEDVGWYRDELKALVERIQPAHAKVSRDTGEESFLYLWPLLIVLLAATD